MRTNEKTKRYLRDVSQQQLAQWHSTGPIDVTINKRSAHPMSNPPTLMDISGEKLRLGRPDRREKHPDSWICTQTYHIYQYQVLLETNLETGHTTLVVEKNQHEVNRPETSVSGRREMDLIDADLAYFLQRNNHDSVHRQNARIKAWNTWLRECPESWQSLREAGISRDSVRVDVVKQGARAYGLVVQHGVAKTHPAYPLAEEYVADLLDTLSRMITDALSNSGDGQ